MNLPHFILYLLSVLGKGCCAILTWVQWSIVYFFSPNKTNFSTLCPVSYKLESFVFIHCLVSFQEFFFLRLVETHRFQWSAAQLWSKVEDSLLFLPSILQHSPGPHWWDSRAFCSLWAKLSCLFSNSLLRRKQEALKSGFFVIPGFLPFSARIGWRVSEKIAHSCSQIQHPVMLPILHVSSARWGTLPKF